MSQDARSRDEELISNEHNLSRFCVEHPHVSWVLLAGTVVWGIYGYTHMPQRKDPDIPVKQAMVVTPWPGASAEKVEDLVTRAVERVIASNSKVARIDSVSRTNVSTITFTLSDTLKSTGEVLDDIGGRLAAIRGLPQGAGPIQYLRDFGDTATLLLTVASPKAGPDEISLRANQIRTGIHAVRPASGPPRATLVFSFPPAVDNRLVRLAAMEFEDHLSRRGLGADLRLAQGLGYVAVDGETTAQDAAILGALQDFLDERYPRSELHPDVWAPIVVRDPSEIGAKLARAAGDKYSYRELEDFTDTMEKALLATARTLNGPPLVAKVVRSGILPERVYLFYSQERLASYGLKPQNLPNILQARNITVAGGEIDTGGKSVRVNPSGEFRTESEIGNVSVGASPWGAPLYLRDVADTVRAYQSPPQFLAYYAHPDRQKGWQRNRAIVLSVQMGAGQQIGVFAKAVNATLADLSTRLPKDLIIDRTSDQPRQVKENIELFMNSLYEAIVLVVLVSLVGFWEWRSALLMALSIPLTLLMTFGMSQVLGIDLQQVSIASLIIALGLLVDDPVVAGDAIKRDLGAGHPPRIAAWLGPTKLATAILYATITNVVAYLPFLLLPGSTGQFLFALPVVMTCALVASRIVSMTFVPLLGRHLLRPKRELSVEQRRSQGFAARYYRVGQFAIRHRWAVLSASLLVLAAGGLIGSRLKQQFFPKDLAYLAYIDIFLPEDAPFSVTNETAERVEQVVRETAEQQKRPLVSLSTFVGGGAPRFWYSLAAEPQHPNYAQVVLVFQDKHDSQHLLPILQERLSRCIAGARLDVRNLETGDAVGLPVAIRISGDHIETLRATAMRIRALLAADPKSSRPRDDWGEDRFNVELDIDSDSANLAGVTNLDVAASSATAINGYQLTTLREGDKQIPVVARLRLNERAQLGDINSLYVYAIQGTQKVPLRQVSQMQYSLRNEVVRRRNQYRTITVSAMPREGVLASEIMNDIRPQLGEIAGSLPPGYRLEIGGEEEKTKEGFGNLALLLAVSIVLIFLSLVFQFKNAVKPFIVFAAVPYGAVGALAGLWIMGAPFGFMGFLGVVSLVGVIVSHIIVLFDFIEEKHAEGEQFETAVLDAGIMRLRPVLITVGATVIALFPLALHGGPLWQPMCYAQIGGLTAATFITLLLVPVIYAIIVLDLKWVKWGTLSVPLV